MSKNDDKKPLSIEESAELLGAELREDIGPVSLDPIGMQAMANQIARRLVSKRGRARDHTWLSAVRSQ